MTAHNMDEAMLKLEKKSIAQAIFVIGYVRDPLIRTKQFDIEKSFQTLIPAASTNTNLPDNFNPQAPRVTISQGLVSVQFSQVSAQLTIDIDESAEPSIDEIKDTVTAAVILFQSCLYNVVSPENQLERGLVLAVKYLVDINAYKDEDIFQYIQSRFITIPALGIPASASLNIGYKTVDNYFINFGISQYKMVSGEMPVGQEGFLLDLSKLPISETGIELKIDINSRPLVNSHKKIEDAASVILKKAFDFLCTEADNFMGIKQ